MLSANQMRMLLTGASALLAAFAQTATQAATLNVSRCVASVNKTMSDGKSVTFWEFGTGGMCSGTLPGSEIDVGVGDTLNLTLSINGMTPQEASPYSGHTIHMHGADLATAEDGVPETGAATTGDTYTWSPAAGTEGSYAYHCHVHTVKHLEMGMYGALVVRPKDANGNFLNQLNSNATTAYDYVQTYLFSTVDPTYHTATGDSTVFADYNPVYFLISGNEGKTTSSPAITLAAAVNKKVALRLIGMQSVNGTFAIKDGSGNVQIFTVYIQDGRTLPTAKTVNTLDVTPGQRYDILFTTPATTGTWYPQITYKKLRDSSAYATAYGKVTF